ncbi:MAG: DUF1540 domain-containing protein [Eubacterium sp.]|nr:DUF1540 domain-containing protein [Eubacterium sp.]MCD7854214.1 DUF1540 domain-containing protein [Clostridiales bacterium]
MEINKAIKCRVDSCRYHDRSQYCTLTDITVGKECDCSKEKCDTECTSFECMD